MASLPATAMKCRQRARHTAGGSLTCAFLRQPADNLLCEEEISYDESSEEQVTISCGGDALLESC